MSWISNAWHWAGEHPWKAAGIALGAVAVVAAGVCIAVFGLPAVVAGLGAAAVAVGTTLLAGAVSTPGRMLVGAGIGAVANGLAYAGTQWWRGQPINKKTLKAAVIGGAAGGAIAGLTFGASLVGTAATDVAVTGSTTAATAATIYTPATVGAVSGGVQQVVLNVENGKAPGDGVFAAASENGVAAGIAGPVLGAAVDKFLPGLLPEVPVAGQTVVTIFKHPMTIVTIDNIAAYVASNPFVANATTSTADQVKAAKGDTPQQPEQVTGMTQALGAATDANKKDTDHQ
jgi:hypothetical protein